MIYFIHCPETNAVKIGFASDPWKRFSKIQSDNAAELVLLALEEGDETRERELHSQFALLRKRGEWFHCATTLSAYIATLPQFDKLRKRKRLGGKLGCWLFDNHLTIAEFAPRVGVSHATISRICAGSWMPSADLMEKIAHATQGEVLPNDWFPSLSQLLADEAA